MNFNGVNQGPQSVCRFETTPPPGSSTPAAIYVSRIRYDVIRPCGAFQGINMLQSVGIGATNSSVSVSWFWTATVQSALAVKGPYSNALTLTNNMTNSYTPPSATNLAKFFRLQFPSYPSYLNTNIILSTP